MLQAKEALFVILIFCYNYRVNYFADADGNWTGTRIVKDLAFFILMSMDSLNTYFCRGIDPFAAFKFYFMIGIDGLILWLHYRSIFRSSWIPLLVIRMILNCILALTSFPLWKSSSAGQRSQTSWKFFFLTVAHAILISDLIRMSCFFLTESSIHQRLIPLGLFLFLAGISCAFMTARRQFPSKIRLMFLLGFSAVFTWLLMALRRFRYEMRNENFLQLKDNLLAIQVARKISPNFDGQQFKQQVLMRYFGWVPSWIWDLISDSVITNHLIPLFSIEYPLDYNLESLYRLPEFAEIALGGFDDESLFMISPFDLYAKDTGKKEEFRKQALRTALSYFANYYRLAWMLYGLCCMINIWVLVSGEKWVRIQFHALNEKIRRKLFAKQKDE